MCSECFFAQLEAEASSVVGTPVDAPPQRAPAVPAASDAADKHIRNAWILAVVSATFTVGLVIYTIACGRDPSKIEPIDWNLTDVVLLLGLARGVAKHSRICAVGLVLYWILATIMKMRMMGSKLGVVGAVGSVIFLYVFVRGAIAAFKYHAARPAVTRPNAPLP